MIDIRIDTAQLQTALTELKGWVVERATSESPSPLALCDASTQPTGFTLPRGTVV